MFQSPPARRSALRAGLPFALAALMAGPPAIVGAWVTSETSAAQVYSTVVGQRKQMTLGTRGVVSLNTATILRVSETTGGYACELERGEALFEVPNSARPPLRVRAGPLWLETKGSVFAIRVRDAKHVDVVVRDGAVQLSAAREATVVEGPQIAQISPSGIAVQPATDADLARRLEWIAGRISFSGETLAEATAEFNRYNERKLVIADESIRDVTIGGRFQYTDVESFLAALVPIGVESQDGGTSPSGAPLVRLVAAGGPRR